MAKAKKSKSKPGDDGRKVVATNRKARYEYEILETLEAGLVLVGTEVKSLRAGRCNLTGGFAVIEEDGGWVKGIEIEEYSHGNRLNHDPKRPRRLLLHKQELRKLRARTRERGFTLIPLRIYFREGRAKVEVGVARGRQLHDRRQAKAKKEAARDIARAVGRRR